MSNTFNPDYPIVVGLAGKAATGKTSAAEAIVPKASFSNSRGGVVWDHIFFAMPLYEFYSIRTKIEGQNSQSRKLFGIHEVLYDLYGGSPLGNMPEYDNLVSLTKQIANKPLDFAGSKPRTFLQQTGDLCRDHDPECFAKWGIRKCNQMHKEYIKGLTEDDVEKPHCILVSDVRFKNEAEIILSQPNGMLIIYDASPDVRRERIFGRDGVYMTDEQMSHKSEKEIDMFTDSASATIDSSSMSVEQQAEETMKIIKERFGIDTHAKN